MFLLLLFFFVGGGVQNKHMSLLCILGNTNKGTSFYDRKYKVKNPEKVFHVCDARTF